MGIAPHPRISQVRAWPSGALLEAVVLTQREAHGASAPEEANHRLGPREIAQWPKSHHCPLLRVAAFWLWLKCKLYLEGMTQKSISSLD